MNKSNTQIQQDIKKAFDEDIASGDITAALIDEKAQLNVSLICRESAVICGLQWFTEAFQQLDPDISFEWYAKEGEYVQNNTIVCTIQGNARAILSAERTALNYLQTLSATATATRQYQEEIKHTKCRVLDTRKTIPGMRIAQKYAVKCGGGSNHRTGLFDAYLIKENHLAASGSIASAVQKARELNPQVLLVLEVENLDQLQQALAAKVDRVLLDNFTIDMLQQAVSLVKGQIGLEASGNITLDTIAEIAETGIDFVSIGALTKNIQAIDYSLRFND